MWIDSTVLCTSANIPSYITDSWLFIYTNFSLNNIEVCRISNWMIGAYPHNDFLVATRDLLFEYWRKENYAVNYFIFHMFFTMVTEQYEELWQQIPKFHNLNPHILQYEFDHLYSEGRMEQIMQFSQFHKLTYQLEKKCGNIKGSYYDVLINQGNIPHSE